MHETEKSPEDIAAGLPLDEAVLKFKKNSSPKRWRQPAINPK
jgi:hypothetical protein